MLRSVLPREPNLFALTKRRAFRLLSAHILTRGFSRANEHCIEIWFGILTRKALRHASFASIAELRQRILKFVDYFNETMAREFNWTYKARAQLIELAKPAS
jgi:hypothetical protein